MYRRYRLLQQTPLVSVSCSNFDSDAEMPTRSVDWDSQYRLRADGQDLSSCSGLDEEGLITIQQNLSQGSSAKILSSLLLTGPPGSGKTHLISCLAVEYSSDLAVLRVPAQALLNSEGESRRLFQHLQSQQGQQPRRYLLAIDNLDVLLGGSVDSGAGRALSELTDCLLTCGKLPVVLSTCRPWQLMSEQPRLRDLLKRSTVCLSRAPGRAERRRILAGLAKLKDAWAPFQFSLRSADFNGSDDAVENLTQPAMLEVILSASEGMSPRDLVCLLHQAANFPIKRLVDQRVRLVDNPDLLQLDSADIGRVLAECHASVSDEEWRRYSIWAASFCGENDD
ncbi:hypothetical protein BOX15_Mlig019393g1 [Macrostomum lignano]|uniref:AAA+ ATPase domain-containing protein n=1 Tax=Macrostomum lignano TaxID=282301 RepID=A0A267H600_9PLAT|nr:hypothetical protein BOX15_Mlig019393g1 [Macrostomum lignano]